MTRSIEVRNKKISVERNRDTKKEEEPPKSLKVVAETMAGLSTETPKSHYSTGSASKPGSSLGRLQ